MDVDKNGLQTFEIVCPSTAADGIPTRTNVLCLGYEFKCGDGKVEIVKVE